ncbi:MAG: 2-oxoacid:acceptor oxidoreductase subunit alpha, partial [Saprospiraceae bacterium]|nr:2-oxoacid:acceptor oxidoreductase subunit alpha [Saprospiraceae bacterium]
KWDDRRIYDRGKVLTAKDLENMDVFGRYLDVDNDGICYRTIPGTHPTKGSFFTRGTSRDEYAAYTEDGAAYVRNVDRLLHKWETAKEYVPGPEFYQKDKQSALGVIFFGTTTYAALEAVDMLKDQGIVMDAMRVKAFPFNDQVKEFIDGHDRVFIVEQNRDAQFKSLLINETGLRASKIASVLNYDGFPITAEAICSQIVENLIGKLSPAFVVHEAAPPSDSDVEE